MSAEETYMANETTKKTVDGDEVILFTKEMKGFFNTENFKEE